MVTWGVSTSRAFSFRIRWPSYFFLWRSNSVSNSSISICASSKALCRTGFSSLKSVGTASPNMNVIHASFQCRRRSFLSNTSFSETRQYGKEMSFPNGGSAWTNNSMQLKQEMCLRYMETEILTKNDEEKLRKKENLTDCGTSHFNNNPRPPYSKVASNLGSKRFNASNDSDCINPPTNILSEGFRKQEPINFERNENVVTIDRMESRAPFLETTKVSSSQCNGDINSLAGRRSMTKPENSDLHNQAVLMQSKKKYTSSQIGMGSTVPHVPDVSPNGRNQSTSLGKVNSAPKTLKFTEAANGIKRGVAVEELSKVIINGSGTKERAFLDDVRAWSYSTASLKQEKRLRFMETEILTKNDEEKLRKKENLTDCGTSHCNNNPRPPYSKLPSNLGSKCSNASNDFDCINPPTNILLDGFRKQEPINFGRTENVVTIDRMECRAPLVETTKVSSVQCNRDNNYSGAIWSMTKPGNNDLHNEAVLVQSKKKYTSSQIGKGSIVPHVPDVSPNGRNQSTSLGKVNSVPKTLKFTEAANGIKRGVAVEELSKVIINESGTKVMEAPATACKPDIKERFSGVYDSGLVVDSVSAGKEAVSMLTTKYRNLVHACDTEVAKIDVKQETLIDHGEVICFSIYSAPETDFGNGKSCLWVDVLDGGGKEILLQFALFFEDPLIRKAVLMQSKKKSTSSQIGKGSIVPHVPDVSPNGRNQSTSLGKVNSVPKTLKLTEAADGIKRGIAVEELSKVIINGSGTREMEAPATTCRPDIKERLNGVYDSVLVVDSVSAAKEVVSMLTTKYRNLVHACDTEVAKIDVKHETPIDHGEVICFSIYSGPEADFRNGKSCIWVDVLDGGGKEILLQFAPFFEDPFIRKVWHNYSFDNHIIENYGIKLSGFHADTMHMARLWDSSRRVIGGYSLEALSSDPKVMSGTELGQEKELIGKVSMKTIFGRKKKKMDGSEGKVVVIPPVEELQREERKPWVSYSALDSICTLKLYESLKKKLSEMPLERDGIRITGQTMFNFYEEYWKPFGELLVRMETEGMLVDRSYLAVIEKLATVEREVAANEFRNWASKYCSDAKYMNVGSDAQVRQLLFGGACNSKNPEVFLPIKRTFKVPNSEKVIEGGKKTPSMFRNITLHCIKDKAFSTEIYTESGWPSVGVAALKILAGKVSAEFDDLAVDLCSDNEVDNDFQMMPHEESKGHMSDNDTALEEFKSLEESKEACHAFAALCEVCSIDSLISNFILPLQGSNISGKNGRVHCSLNINTETGRLSARRPNLQNQPALEKDRYKIRQAFIAAPGNSLIVADYGQLELRILAHLTNCKSMLEAFKAGGDFHSRTAMNMYPHIRKAVEEGSVLLEWDPQPGQDNPPVPLLKDAFASERRKAKMLNFSIAYGKTPVRLSKDWKVSLAEAKKTVNLWYNERKEVRKWQDLQMAEAEEKSCVRTLLGRACRFPSMKHAIERSAINAALQGSVADVAMCAMLEISKNSRLRELEWRLLLQVHDEVILEGPTESAEVAKAIVVECMSKPFNGKNILNVDLAVNAKCEQNWYSAK